MKLIQNVLYLPFFLIFPLNLLSTTIELATNLGYDTNVGLDSLNLKSSFLEYQLFTEFNRKNDILKSHHLLSLTANYRDYFRYDDNYELNLRLSNYKYLNDYTKFDLTPTFVIYRDNLFYDNDYNLISLSTNVTNFIKSDLEVSLGFLIGNKSYFKYIPDSIKKQYRLRRLRENKLESQNKPSSRSQLNTSQKKNNNLNYSYDDREDTIYNIYIQAEHYFSKKLNTILNLSFLRNESNVELEEYLSYKFSFSINYEINKNLNTRIDIQFEKDIYDEYFNNRSRNDYIVSFSLRNDYKLNNKLNVYTEYDFIRNNSIVNIDNANKLEIKCGFSFLF